MKRRLRLQDHDHVHAIGYIGYTPVIILAESPNKKWRAVAHMGSFKIYERVYAQWGSPLGNGYQWRVAQTIARLRPYRGAATVKKLSDFTFEEQQSVIRALHRRISESATSTR